MASGSNPRVGTNSEPGTTQVQVSNEFVLGGQRVVLIGTPGFDDVTLNDTDILKLIAAFLAAT